MTALPARPRTETASYRFPPASPTTVPPADQCDREQLIDLAAGAAKHVDQLWQLCNSEAHVKALCLEVSERIEPELRASEDNRVREVRALQEQLAAVQTHAARIERLLDASNNARQADVLELARLREESATQTLLVISHLREAVRLQGTLATMSNELAVTRAAMSQLAHSRHLAIVAARAARVGRCFDLTDVT